VGGADDELHQVARAVWTATLVALVLLCTLLVLRRLEGQFRQPLSPLALVAVALLGTVVVGALRLSWPHRPAARRHRSEISQRLFAPAGCLMLLAVSVSLPDSHPAALAAFWMIVLVAESGWWYAGLRGRISLSPQIGTLWQRVTTRRAMALPAAFQRLGQHRPTEVEVTEEEDEELESLPAEVTQRLTRLRVGDDGELVFGLVRAGFDAGERSQNIHLAFCPPLEGSPALTVQQVAGPAVTIKTAVAESYGARLELKLTAKPAQLETVVIRFEALWQPRLSQEQTNA